MALDTSIALNANAPQPTNPLQTALQVAQFRAYNANGLQAQQSLAANRAISRAYQQATDPTTGQVDNNKLMGIISQDPDAANKLGEVVQSINTQKQQQATLDGTRLDQAQKAQGALRSGMGSLLTKADLSPTDIQGFVGTMVKAGAIPQQVAEAELQSMPQDPAQIRPWLAQHFNSALSGEQQLANLKPQFAQINTGPATVAVNQNPNAIGANGHPMGVGSVGYAVNNGLSPSDAAAQVPVVNADGTPGTRSRASVLEEQGYGGALPAGFKSNGRYGAPNGGVVATGPAPGVADANQKANAAGGDMLVSDQQSNAQSGTRINMLQNAQQALASADSGQKSEGLQNLRGALVTFGLASQEQANKVASYDEANKYLTQYAQNKASSFGHGTDSQLAAAMTGNGSTKISNLAAQDVVKVNLGLERMEQARMQAWQSAGLQPSQYGAWKSQFGSTMDPRVFIADQIDPVKIQGMVKKMNPKEQATFRTQYNWAVQNGFINGPQ
jgi:hypothetical protein